MFSLFASSLTEGSTLNESNLMVFGEYGFYAGLIILFAPIPAFAFAIWKERFGLSIFVSILGILVGIAMFILYATSVPEPSPSPLPTVTPLFAVALTTLAMSSYLGYGNRVFRKISGGEVPEAYLY